MNGRAKRFDYRDFEVILRKNGYIKIRNGKGNHKVYGKEGKANIIISRKRLNKMIALRLIKENDLKID